MSLPIVAIVGRPNVGKSSLLNRLAKQLISIVDPTAGVTRDRVSTICEIGERYFELVDTGGYGIEDRDDLTEHVEHQIELAVSAAALILFVTDAQTGVVPLDVRVAELLRRQDRNVILVANKVDSPKAEPAATEFYKLGFGDPLCVSALHGFGREDLFEAIAKRLPETSPGPPPEPVMKIALVGKRNVGKSTFINALAGEERVIVSEVPGTTRDAIDVRFEMDDRTLIAIDTAGVRKRTKLADSIEFYGYSRATWSIRRADVVLLLIDATADISVTDKKLARYILDEFKPCILVVNKWDLAKDRAASEAYGEYLTKTLPGMNFAPIAFTTATDDRNVRSTIELASTLFKQAHTRVSTARLNQILEEVLEARGPGTKRGAKTPKIYYATQVGVSPPTLVFFVNHPDALTTEYRRFLLNRFRDVLPFGEIPIRFLFRSHRPD